MKQVTTKVLAEKWGISQRRILRLAKEGKIPGAKQYGNSWLFPDNAVKPVDGRTRQAKEKPQKDFFRFPLYVNFEADAYNPPLSKEEISLREAQILFFAGQFEEAGVILEKSAKGSQNIYIKISVTFFRCLVSLAKNDGSECKRFANALRLLLSEDFPHKKEMMLHIPLLDLYFGLMKSIDDDLNIEPDYPYSPDSLPLLAMLSFFWYAKIENENIAVKLDSFEIFCLQFENSGHFYEAQELHLALFLGYYMLANEKMMFHHLKKALTLAQEHSMFFSSATYAPYYPDVFNQVLSEFPPDFAEKICDMGKRFSASLGLFLDKKHTSDFYTVLSQNDYRFLVLTYQGYTNKEIAGILKVSEKTVSNHFSEIYNKLGVQNKREMLDLLKDAISK